MRVIHQRQRLPFALEARNHLPAVHARLDDLERHVPAKRVRLLRVIDHAHAAFPELANQFVGPTETRMRAEIPTAIEAVTAL